MRIFQSAWALVISALLLSVQAKAGAEIAPCDTSFFNNTICPGQSLFIAGNIFDVQNLTGEVVFPGASWDGTDSVVVVNLVLSPPVTEVIEASYCNNQALVVNGQVYDAAHPSGMELLPGGALGGCDSLILIDLHFLSPAQFHLQQTICNNDTVWVNNQAYDQYYYLGMETVEGGAANGCDSVILVDLTVLPTARDTFLSTLCPSDFLTINGTTYDEKHPEGVERLPNAAANGCDSLIYVQISFFDSMVEPDFLGENQSVNLGDSVCIALPDDLTLSSIEWQHVSLCPDTACSSVCFWATRDQWVICTLMDDNGCSFSDSVLVEVSTTRPVYIPNVFNPDGAPPNNRFQVYSGIPGTRIQWLRVFDRWGSLVYAAKDALPDTENAGWDGTIRGELAQPDVFTYTLELLFPGGEKEIRSGTVTVVR